MLRNKELLISVDDKGNYSQVFKATSTAKREPIISIPVPESKTKEYLKMAKESIDKAVNININILVNGELLPTNYIKKILTIIND